MAKLSIIVPVYNVDQYLKQCLESIINQTMKDIEIICVNDGSTDNSKDILLTYAQKDKRIIVINKENSGYGHTMNVGLEHATGDYIGIVESDDFAEIDMYEKLYNIAQQRDAEVVKSNYYSYKTFSGIDRQFEESLRDCRYNCVFNPSEDKNIFFTACSVWSGIYKRQFLLKNKIRFNETPGASFQDTSFAFIVWACAEKVILTKEAYINYRIDNPGSSLKSPDKVFCLCDEFEVIERFLERYPSKKEKLINLETVLKNRTYLWFYPRLASAFQYTFLWRMAEGLKRDFEKGLFKPDDFKDEEWNKLQSIMTDLNVYYKSTAKDYYDERMTLFSTLNGHMYLLGLLSIIDNYHTIIIYGAGAIGKNIAQKFLDEKKDIMKLCFAVSDTKDNPSSLLGIPVKPIYDLIGFNKECLVLVATKERLQYDIMNTLQKLEFGNIIAIDSWLLQNLY